MALIDWARGVSGLPGHAQAGGGGRGGAWTVQASQFGGTDVDGGGGGGAPDEGSGTSSTSVSAERDGGGGAFGGDKASFDAGPLGDARYRGQHGRGGSTAWADNPSIGNHPESYTEHLHRGYPFPPQPTTRHSAPPSRYGWQSPPITERTGQEDEVSLMERMTVGGTTLGWLTTAGGVPL